MTTSEQPDFDVMMMDPDNNLELMPGLGGRVYRGSHADTALRHLSRVLVVRHERTLEPILKAMTSLASSRVRGSRLVVLGPLSEPTAAVARARFEHLVSGHATSLPLEQLVEALVSPDRQDRFIAGTVDLSTESLVLVRGDLTELVVPLGSFRPADNNVTPDFSRFSLIDYGQGIQFGDFEASSASVLYTHDASFRRRKKKLRRVQDKTYGACVRRLRIMRGLTQDDFDGISRKTIQRIESGKTPKDRVQESTMNAIATGLRVEPNEIEDY